MAQYLYLVGGFALSAFIWEHAANINQWQRKPSVYLTTGVEHSRRFFTRVGKVIARVSSFYTYLHLAELGQSFLGLAVPTGRLILSPFWTFVGYVQSLKLYEQAKSGNGWVVLFGTSTLLGLACTAAWYFGLTRSLSSLGALFPMPSIRRLLSR
jgi:hypothetical protein